LKTNNLIINWELDLSASPANLQVVFILHTSYNRNLWVAWFNLAVAFFFFP